ncbi:MDR family MFS transporter [Rhodococcoides fascians]|uniref:MDR family MFS transporter n=1 Tax=Rhodococcoides fascians TaxID=1828 RepID=UPI00050C8C7C|nr:MDR family MFS transporter [Rhodococcus fascians]
MTTTSAENPPNQAVADPDAMTHRQILEALTGLLAALFTALLSTTIVSTALPTIIGDLKGSQTAYAWVITTALLANAASTPIWGKLADLFNKKVLVQSSILIFVAGSLIAGFAHNVPVLLAARVVQGIGMGGLTALVIAIIGTIVSPRDRGRYSGYTGAVMAVSMSGGPILGGVIVDSPLGWRWCFFVCVPLAVIALGLLQKTLHIKTVRKDNVSIDWLGALLLTAGVSVLLVWVSFAGKADYYAWISRETAYLVGGGVALLVLTIIVEARHKSPIIPLKIVTERTTGLAIIASIAVGVGLFGATTFLGQYFQTARGYTPTEAGLLSIPLVFGMLVASVGSGQLITKFGQWKPFIVTGSILLVIGFLLLGTIDHATSLVTVGIFITIVGLGTGMLMQNLVLAVQNTVSVQNVGAASSTVAFFRTFGGAIGVSVLGSLLATRVAEKSAAGLAQLGVDGSAGGGGSLDLTALPAPIVSVIRTAYGDATGRIFMIAGFVAIVTLIAVVFIPNRPLRKTIDITSAPAQGPVADLDKTDLDQNDLDGDAQAQPERREQLAEIPSFGATQDYVGAQYGNERRFERRNEGRHEAQPGQRPFDGLSTDARDRLLTLLLPQPEDTLTALDEAEAIRAEVIELQQELDAKMLDFDAVCERLRRLGLSEQQVARVLGDNHIPDSHNHYANAGLNGHSVN